MFYSPESIATVSLVKDVLNIDETSIYFDSRESLTMYVHHKDQMYELWEYEKGL